MIKRYRKKLFMKNNFFWFVIFSRGSYSWAQSPMWGPPGYPAVSRGGCWSQQFCRVSPASADSHLLRGGMSVMAASCPLCRAPTSAPHGRSWEPAQSGSHTWKNLCPAFASLVELRQLENPPIQESDFFSLLHAAYTTALVPPRTACWRESVGPAAISSSLENQTVPWGLSPRCCPWGSTQL